MIEINRIANTVNHGNLSGATFNTSGRRQYLRTGYMVGITQTLSELTKTGWKESYTLYDLNNILKELSEQYINALGRFYIGFWKDQETGIKYWDIVICLKNRKLALDTAAQHYELAIWDNKNSKQIRVL